MLNRTAILKNMQLLLEAQKENHGELMSISLGATTLIQLLQMLQSTKKSQTKAAAVLLYRFQMEFHGKVPKKVNEKV